MQCDYLIVGSGLTGATIARILKDHNKNVLVVERRNCIGGNVVDEIHPSGIRMNKYGPHCFRTNDQELWDWVNKFALFHTFEPIVKCRLDSGNLEAWPPHMTKYDQPYLSDIVPTNFEEAALSKVSERIYNNMIKGYTEKMWGVPASSLSPELFDRIDVRYDVNSQADIRFKTEKYQGVLTNGYTDFMLKLLSGIPIILNYNFLMNKYQIAAQKAIFFTGPIDEYFDYCLGKLDYRSHTRITECYRGSDHFFLFDDCFQINEPDPYVNFLRSIEWKYLLPDSYKYIHDTILTREISTAATQPDEYEYPVPDKKNAELYSKYQELAVEEKNVVFCGRLGEYKYYDMDQAITRAFDIAKEHC